jgi:FdhE protein
LRSAAQRWREEGEGRWRTLLETSVSGDVNELDATEDFFARACLQPAAENLQTQWPAVSNYVGSICPICGGLAQLSVLRPEGEGASRSLICSFCLYEWPFLRIACPWCGEKDKEKLPRYSAEECDYVHVEACDTCLHYLKAVDLSRNGLANPVVDETALAVLDVWATDRGYQKIIRNLVGF